MPRKPSRPEQPATITIGGQTYTAKAFDLEPTPQGTPDPARATPNPSEPDRPPTTSLDRVVTSQRFEYTPPADGETTFAADDDERFGKGASIGRVRFAGIMRGPMTATASFFLAIPASDILRMIAFVERGERAERAKNAEQNVRAFEEQTWIMERARARRIRDRLRGFGLL